MFVIIWRFHVDARDAASFEEHYGAEGSWARLFRKSGEYRGTELLRAAGRDVSYVTIDRWESREGFGRFKAEHSEEYQALDRACEALTRGEQKIGEFEG